MADEAMIPQTLEEGYAHIYAKATLPNFGIREIRALVYRGKQTPARAWMDYIQSATMHTGGWIDVEVRGESRWEDGLLVETWAPMALNLNHYADLSAFEPEEPSTRPL